jgi:anti-sigma regulatory factor (Ser/Thr protein kinase)
MDAVLSDQWLSGLSTHYVLDAASVTLLQREVREQAAQLGLSAVISGSLVNIASELAQNQLAHARVGRIALRPLLRDGVRGLEIIAADEGGGIVDPSTALAGAPRPLDPAAPAKQSLGIGLSAVREFADELDFDVRLQEGSCVWARKFAAPVARRREVGIYGRPFPGEEASGDQALFERDEDSLLLVVLDGLGHGLPARDAADVAVASLRSEAHTSLPSMLESCHTALHKTRGAVATVARVLEREDELEVAGVGNVTLHLAGPGRSSRVSGALWVLGSPGPRRKPVLERMPLAARDAVVLFSDGLSARFELSQELDLLREHPIIIAQQLLQRFARANDDALVLVAR